MRALGIVIPAHVLSATRACGSDRNKVSFSSSSRTPPLKLSMKAFWTGLPGAT
jgi:hypothetical protein